MKLPIQLLAALFLMLFLVHHAEAVVTPKLGEDSEFLKDKFGADSLEEFMNMSAKEIGEARGKKLKLREKIVLKLVQRKIKKQLKRGEKVDVEASFSSTNRRFNLGGFLLGLILGPIGVLIAILFGGNAIRSALFGFLIWLIVILVIWLT